jgi:beta-galactosidase beta subunit
MVLDKLLNSEKYLFKNKGIETAIEYLKTADFSLIEDGKNNIKGENIKVIISTYMTRKIINIFISGCY